MYLIFMKNLTPLARRCDSAELALPSVKSISAEFNFAESALTASFCGISLDMAKLNPQNWVITRFLKK